MSKTIYDLQGIAAFGCGIIIDAGKYNTEDIKSIITIIKTHQSQIILKNARSIADIETIAEFGTGNVTFDLS